MKHQGEQIFGDYKLSTPIGKGPFSEVWLAHHVRTGAPVAVKMYTDPTCAAELEGRKLRPWNPHPSIVGLLEVSPHLVCEYVQGTSLRHLLNERSRLSPRRALSIIAQALDALSAAGRVHGGLRPENILIDARERVHISDFLTAQTTVSVAQRLRFGASHGDQSAKMILRVFDYLSPEQRAGRLLDARTDIFTLGVVLYEMLTGSRHALRFPIEGVVPEISRLVSRATSESERYPTIAEFRQDVLQALEGPAEDLISFEADTPRRSLWWMWVPAAVVLLGALAVLAGFSKLPGIRSENSPPEPSRSSTNQPVPVGATRETRFERVPALEGCKDCLDTGKCKVCLGQGKEDCARCRAGRKVTNECRTCKGKGTCATCEGAGQVDCRGPMGNDEEDTCDNGIVRLHRVECPLGCPQHYTCGVHEHSAPNCIRCGGDGRCSLCSNVHGSGKVTCTACNGAKECSTCKGSRRVEEPCADCDMGKKPCAFCGGTGKCPSCRR